MEILQWLKPPEMVHYVQNLANLASQGGNAIMSSSVVMSAYLLIFAFKRTIGRAKICSAAFLCIAISYSPLYYIISEIYYYLLLAMIYFYLVGNVAPKINLRRRGTITPLFMSILACAAMGTFEVFMAVDTWSSDGFETWASKHYEAVAFCIHACIVSPFILYDTARLWRSLGRLIGNMCSLLWDKVYMALMWYDHSYHKH